MYEDIGLEYKFCLNEFEDCQKIIGDEKLVKQSKFIEKQYKCSLFVYNLKIKDKYDHTKTHNILPKDLEGEEGLKYLELRGHCQEGDLDLFQRMMIQFSLRFQGVGIVFFPSQTKKLVDL